jgi:Uma2 family endonuclease
LVELILRSTTNLRTIQEEPMAIAAPTPATDAEGDQCVVLADIGWEGYSKLLKIRGERSIPRMIYLGGSVLLMSPSIPHERLAELLGAFVLVVAEELDIPLHMAGSTTFRRRAKRGGVEGDKTFYFTNLDRIRGKKKISLRVDPPPDLAIEVVVTRDADDAIEVYRRLGVPEVWICEVRRFTILRLEANGQYEESQCSRAFPVLTAGEIHAWVSRQNDESDTAWTKDLRRWVREVLVPRHRQRKTHDVVAPEKPGEQVS